MLQDLQPNKIIITGFVVQPQAGVEFTVSVPNQSKTNIKADLHALPDGVALQQFKWADNHLWKNFWAECSSKQQPQTLPKSSRYPSRKIIAGSNQFLVYQVEDFDCTKGEYYISWVDYDDSENTWEPLRSLARPPMTYAWATREAWQRCCKYFGNKIKPKLCSAQDLQAGKRKRMVSCWS